MRQIHAACGQRLPSYPLAERQAAIAVAMQTQPLGLVFPECRGECVVVGLCLLLCVGHGGQGAIGAFPDGHAALMLATARLRYLAGTYWGAKRYLCMEERNKRQALTTVAA